MKTTREQRNSLSAGKITAVANPHSIIRDIAADCNVLEEECVALRKFAGEQVCIAQGVKLENDKLRAQLAAAIARAEKAKGNWQGAHELEMSLVREVNLAAKVKKLPQELEEVTQQASQIPGLEDHAHQQASEILDLRAQLAAATSLINEIANMPETVCGCYSYPPFVNGENRMLVKIKAHIKAALEAKP
jgi:hypothetical protein